MLIASVVSTFGGFLAKIATMEISSLETVFFRNIIGLIIISMALYNKPPNFEGGRLFLLFSRGFLGFLGILFYFYSIQNISLGVAVTLNKTSPLFGALFSFLLLQEGLNRSQVLAIFIAFIGVVIIFVPSGFSFHLGMILGVLGGLSAGLAYTAIRRLKGLYETKEIVFSFTLVGSLFSFLLLVLSEFIDIPSGFEFMFSKFAIPTFYTFTILAALGLCATIAQYFMTKAYENIKVGIAGTIGYSSIPFSIFLGVLVGDEFPSLLVVCGIFLIVLGGILLKEVKKR